MAPLTESVEKSTAVAMPLIAPKFAT